MNALEEVRKLIEKDNIQEAIILLEKVEENTDLQQSELISISFYKAMSLVRLGNYPETLKYAKKVYRAIRKEASYPKLIEILVMMGHASCWLGNFDKGYQYLDEAEQELKKIDDISEERQIQFVIFTHEHELIDIAEVVYEVKNNGTESFIARV